MTMKANKILAALVVTGLAACGGGYSGGGGGGGGQSGTFSCDQQLGGFHSCNDYNWNGGNYSTSSWNAACSMGGGTSGSGCSHSSAIGGCEIKSTSGAVSITSITWYYSGSSATVKSACSSVKGTYVAP